MNNLFNSIIKQLVSEGVCCLSDLEPMDERRLTAALIRDTQDSLGQWEFISEPSSSNELPYLLIDVLEDKQNGVLGLCRPETSLVIMMAQGAIEWSKPRILHAIQEEMNRHLICGEE